MADTAVAPVTSIELHEAMVCAEHREEICDMCNVDYRQENDEFFGFTPADRTALTIPALGGLKDGVWSCKKHTNTECTQCFNWKKQLNKLHKEAKKAGK
ncbi:hypothetical protein M408DRAFT_325551 [Serendipita vermifera MAFF 305830]|uniref:Uncharacterized protein n=1 Tax=Serendipita vermifera MAFF 305830 TaxID=933852 RepID=A0A0C3BPI8_SERVB|nr:hypothetical protein M408DRAFT_325551 [Serendipita vermifera MAFF 305830]